jgi:integrase/recombinase XerD
MAKQPAGGETVHQPTRPGEGEVACPGPSPGQRALARRATTGAHTCGDDDRKGCRACRDEAELQIGERPGVAGELLQDEAPQASSACTALGGYTGPDPHVIKLWLHGRSKHTQRAYLSDADRFFRFTGKALRQTTLEDLQGYVDHLQSLALTDGTRHRLVAGVKSLFAFAARLRYVPFDVAAALRMPAGRDTLNERILEEHEVQQMIRFVSDGRNRLMLQLLYHAGIRVSELVSLKWRDLQAHRGAGQITVFGKGRKTRTIRIEWPMWNALIEPRGNASDDAPVFVSRRGGHLDPSQLLRIVKKAAARAGITKKVSSHWLRHCHASHSLDRGAPISLVQATLGHASVSTTSRYLHARPNESSSKFLPPIG